VHTFADPVERARQTASERTAVVDRDRRLTYAELLDRCARLAGGLARLGVRRGERVAVLAANCHQYVESYLGVPAAGMVFVPLNTRHAVPELEYALRDSGSRVLLTDRDPAPFRGLVDHVVELGEGYDALLASASPASLGEGLAEHDLAGIFYTGGTTGASKGVMLSHRNLMSHTLHWMAAVPHRPEDRFLVMAPMFHAAGTLGLLAAVWVGAAQVLLPAFAPADALDLIERHGITATLGVPTMLAAMAEEQHRRPRATGTLRLIVHGGSPIASEVIRRTHRAFPDAELVEVYGATELSPLATILVGEQHVIDDARARSCGRAMPGVDVRVLGPDGAELPRGQAGEVVVRGPNVMLGYWNKPAETAAVLKDTGYWTGDVGYMDAEGFLFLIDRSKDMIVSGGENVYSTEVEEVLYRHPAVLEAAVFGVPDDRWGEVVHAVVVPRPEFADVKPDEIIAFCRSHIAGYKLPKAVTLRADPLPKSGPGKVLKRELRAPFWKGHERSVH
jgi:long-chain acyl-CoA synthetase